MRYFVFLKLKMHQNVSTNSNKCSNSGIIWAQFIASIPNRIMLIHHVGQ